MEPKTRLRGPNFTSSDSLLLCDIIAKHKHIIENKKTDGANLLQKQEAWLKVVNEFNALTTGYSRTVESLQQNYKNLKKKAKKNASEAKMDIPVDRTALVYNIEEHGTSSEGWKKTSEGTGAPIKTCQILFEALSKEADMKERCLKKNIMGTGGGPPPKFNDDPLLEKVKGLVGSSIEGLYTIYDGDSSIMALQNVPAIEKKNEIIKEDSQLTEMNDITNEAIDEQQSQGDTRGTPIMTPKTHLSQADQSYFTNNRANLKRKPHDLLTRKRRLESQIPEKQSVSEKFKVLASEKMEYVQMQKELLNMQLLEEKEKLEHNRLLRTMEIEDAKAKYAHNIELRKLELEKFKSK